jgi:hypothetical protein
MTELERLVDRLCNDPKRKLLNFHVTRGEAVCTVEELCAELNSALDQVESGQATRGAPKSGLAPMTVDEFLSTIPGR